MKHLQSLRFSLLIAALFCFSGCDDDDNGDDGPRLTGNNKVYELSSVSDPAISGTVTFAERDDNATLVTIDLDGTQSGNTHPAHIHSNSAAAGGGIVLDFTAVDGATGMSETVVTTLNDGAPVSYEELLEFDGYVNVHLSSGDLGTLVAQGDIGQNALTGTQMVYTLNSVSNPEISGTATFTERENGNALITLSLVGTATDGDHPAHIHANSTSEGGGIVLDLANVSGATGRSVTNVTQLNSGVPITYAELIAFDGYINVHLSPSNLATLIAQGDIGANAP